MAEGVGPEFKPQYQKKKKKGKQERWKGTEEQSVVMEACKS
jgi:hypothetical protein